MVAQQRAPQGADVLRLERVDGRFGVDEATPGHVDEHDTLLHGGDSRLVDEVVGLARDERAVQRDDVRLGAELLEGHVGTAQLKKLGVLGSRGGIQGDMA